MDVKTMEYMGERVDKARALTERLKVVDGLIETVEQSARIRVTAEGRNVYGSAIQSEIMVVEKDPGVKQAVMECLSRRRQELQAELDAI